MLVLTTGLMDLASNDLKWRTKQSLVNESHQWSISCNAILFKRIHENTFNLCRFFLGTGSSCHRSVFGHFVANQLQSSRTCNASSNIIESYNTYMHIKSHIEHASKSGLYSTILGFWTGPTAKTIEKEKASVAMFCKQETTLSTNVNVKSGMVSQKTD